jgi:hypothetical protein
VRLIHVVGTGLRKSGITFLNVFIFFIYEGNAGEIVILVSSYTVYTLVYLLMVVWCSPD